MIIANNFSRLISRILIIFNRRNLVIKNMNISQDETSNIMCYTIDLENIEDNMTQLIKQIKKLIGVSHVFYHNTDIKKI